jgi:hypothetical protein
VRVCKGIHIADAAVDLPDALLSEVLASAPSPIKVTLICDDILRELFADSIWHWTYATGNDHVSILDDLMRHVDYCALKRNIEKRDQFYRAEVALLPKWEGINPPTLGTL